MFPVTCISTPILLRSFVLKVATECTYTPKGNEYSGTVSHTQTGIPCQRWDSQTPHSHPNNELHMDENYCRNPDDSAGPWCYTQDPAIRWELCDIPKCGKIIMLNNYFSHFKLCIAICDFGNNKTK
jgi:hypothetical protein